jgi:biuret amidohydrolase
MKHYRGLSIPTTLDELCDPQRTALLVYDMQAGICSQIADGKAIVEQVAKVVAAARSRGMRIVFTRHLSLPKTWMGVVQLRMAMGWQKKAEPAEVTPWFLRDTPSFQITPELTPEPEDAVFDKIAMSAFEGTPLATALSDCGIVGIAIAGIAMEVGIEPTARHAADLGFIPVVIADACGAGHKDAAARSTESLRFAGDAIITDVATFVGKLGKG